MTEYLTTAEAAALLRDALPCSCNTLKDDRFPCWQCEALSAAHPVIAEIQQRAVEAGARYCCRCDGRTLDQPVESLEENVPGASRWYRMGCAQELEMRLRKP